LFALATVTVGLIALCILLSVPFLPAITWGVALAIMAWPMHRWIRRHIERPTLAAIFSTLAVAVLILVPGFFVVYQLAREAANAAAQTQQQSTGQVVREKMSEVPVLNEAVAWMDRTGIDLEAEVRKIIAAYTQDVAALAQGSVASTIQFLVAVFILFHLFKERGVFLHGLRDLLPLSRAESDEVFGRAADSVHANLYATLITSLVDATGGCLMFWLLGLPAPLLWGVVMFILSILPIVGAGLVWFPAAVYLALTGNWPAALALLGWGLASFVVVDNFLYVRLAGKRMRMHEVPALVAFLGGLAIFGVSGMILGPAIFAIAEALLEVWKKRLAIADKVPAPVALAAAAGTVPAAAAPAEPTASRLVIA
jgi:predicted PurR-regulated permease PerM